MLPSTPTPTSRVRVLTTSSHMRIPYARVLASIPRCARRHTTWGDNRRYRQGNSPRWHTCEQPWFRRGERQASAFEGTGGGGRGRRYTQRSTHIFDCWCCTFRDAVSSTRDLCILRCRLPQRSTSHASVLRANTNVERVRCGVRVQRVWPALRVCRA